MIKQVNEHFFDKESKIMYYVLGISYARYSHMLRRYNSYVNRWQSSSKPLLEIVKSALESDHKISGPIKYKHIRGGEDYFENYQFCIYNQKLYESISKQGLGIPKSKRKFPKKIKYPYLNHFLRGFFDAQTTAGSFDNNCKYFQISFKNTSFLQGLERQLVKYVGVTPKEKIKTPLYYYKQSEIKKIHDFLYCDWTFIKKHGLYLPLKKERFEGYISPSHKRINNAKKLLLKGIPSKKVIKKVSYSTLSDFYRAFKNVTGQTVRQYLKNNK